MPLETYSGMFHYKALDKDNKTDFSYKAIFE